MNATLTYLRDNPVAVLDALKAIVAVLSAVGVPVTSGVSAAVGALVIAVLAIVTQKVVGSAVTEAQNAPADEVVPIPTEDGDTTPDLGVDATQVI